MAFEEMEIANVVLVVPPIHLAIVVVVDCDRVLVLNLFVVFGVPLDVVAFVANNLARWQIPLVLSSCL